MPEGPSIVILKELVKGFKKQVILEASGNAKIDMSLLHNQPVKDIKSWGKHFLICLPNITIRIHFLLFGSYSIDEQTKTARALRLHLNFKKGDIYFYTCSVKIIDEKLDDVYDWTADVMNDKWNAKKAKEKLLQMPDTLVCDALLDQDVFAGVGNIIKNEVLYRIKVHPESRVGKLPAAKLNALVKEARLYSFDFLKWKKEFTLKKHWLAHTKKTCTRCNLPMVKKYAGRTKRRTFYCENCQKLY